MGKHKIATNFKEVKHFNLPAEITNHPYIAAFADKMMTLSNRLNEIEDGDEFNDAADIKEEYLPAIREFIWNTTGL